MLDFTNKNGKTLDTIVLAGVNGCGKTTLLEIIRDIFAGNFRISSAEINIELDLKGHSDISFQYFKMLATRNSKLHIDFETNIMTI